ncbi:uncharacterized protein LOC111112209 [Crassostrea virginica]
MAQVFTILWFVAVSFMIGGKVNAYSLVDQSNVSNSSEEYGYYNIYDKIDSLQKAFQTLETNVQRKNNILRQVLQSITEMDDNTEMSDESSQGTKTLQKHDSAVGFPTNLYGTTYSSTSSSIRGIQFSTTEVTPTTGQCSRVQVPGSISFTCR